LVQNGLELKILLPQPPESSYTILDIISCQGARACKQNLGKSQIVKRKLRACFPAKEMLL
jgi:hypothetical protein